MYMASRRARAAAALAALARLSSAARPAQQVAGQIVRHVTGVIDAGVFFVGAVDPHTGLCLGAAAHNIDPAACGPAWEHEFCIPDYNKFADLTLRNPVGDLREATGGRLSRSARYRSLNAIAGLEDELRATLHAGGLSWGNLVLSRRVDEGPFSDDDRTFLAKAAPLAGAALRRAILQEPQRALPADGPGIVVLDEAGAMVSATAEAEIWLRALSAEHQAPAATGIRPELLFMPLIALGAPGAPPRCARLRTPQGAWLAAHASPLGDSGHTGIVIELAKAPEVAPIVMAAFGLTSREVQVAELVARAVSTEEIASALLLSVHTVRGHLKAIFGKTGVCSRGELTAKLFAEHYRGPLADAMSTSIDRVADSAALARESA